MIILVAIETFIIDVCIGSVDLSILLAISIFLKALGVWFCIKTNDDLSRVSYKIYGVIVLLSFLSVIRMYMVSFVINNGGTTKEYITLMTQLVVFIYANVKYRKEDLNLNKSIFKDYFLQVLVTCSSDLLFII